jgi:hypothetical protein
MSYDENSNDAMFSRIIAKLEEQDRTSERARGEMISRLERIEGQTIKTNGRVGNLEKWQTEMKARVGLVALLVSGIGTLATMLIKKIWE